MAKVQAKKTAAKAKRPVAKKPAAQPKRAAVKKAAAAKSPAKGAAKAKPAMARPTAKPAKPAKPAKRAAVKPAKAAPKKAAPAKPQPKAAEKSSKKPATVTKKAAKVVARVAHAAAAVPAAVTKAAGTIATKVTAAVEKKRTRRPRTRVTSNGPAVANWFSQEKARPSSFIPAPPRAEAPSLVAAPPASSDRLIRPEDLNHQAVRTVPVRVDIEQTGGRVMISVTPQEVVLRPGEGIEWDFRYLGGADVTVDEVVIDFDRPSPFGSTAFKSRRPGTARPHRQLSGGASTASSGRRVQYTIRAMSSFRTELAAAKPAVNILLG